MKKTFMLIWALAASAVCMAGSAPPETNREIVKTSDGYIVTYTLPEINVAENFIYPQEKICSLEGFNINTTPGEPAFPFRNDTFIVPKGYSATAELVSGEYKEISGQLSEASTLYEADTENRVAIEPFSGFFPDQAADIASTNRYRGVGLCQVQVSPVQYDSENHKIRLYSKLSYKLKFSQQELLDPENDFQPYISPDDPFLKNIALNFDDIRNPKGMMRSTPLVDESYPVQYLIITTDKLKSAADKFAEWKHALGIKAYVISQNSWTSAQVKSTVKDFYENYASLYYLLILGSNTDIPGVSLLYKGSTFYSDLPYAQISDPLLPDFYRGRISVNSLSDATAVIDKIIDYEKNPVTDPKFYKSASLIGTFIEEYESREKENIPDLPNGTELGRKIFALESVKKVLDSNNISTLRLYNKYSDVDDNFVPSYWYPSTCRGKIGEKIPNELKESNGFQWNSTDKDVVTNFNKGQLFCIYNGHGTNVWWSPINVSAIQLSQTSNGKKLPLVFSTACKSGQFYNGNTSIAEKLLLNRNGGSVATFAPSNNSLDDLNDAFLAGAINAIYPTPNIRNPYVFNYSYSQTLTPAPTYRIGQIMDQGLFRMRETFKNKTYKETDFEYLSSYYYHIYHCHGDPSMRLYTQVPGTYDNVTYTTGRDVQIGNQTYYKVTVNVPGATENTRISCYDKSVDRMTSAWGSSATFNMIRDFDDVVVSVTDVNMKPYILYPEYQGPIFGKKTRPIDKERYYSIIDENRIWEYYTERRRCVMDADNDSYAKIVRMQFKGTTEINGKEYHNVVVTYGYHTTMPYIHPFDGYDPAYDVEYKFEGEETIAYMREEGPKCYMLLHKGDSEESETVWKILGSCYGSEENEYLIYDFSLFPGGIINQFSGLDDEAIAVEKERRSAPYLPYQNWSWWIFEWWENFVYGMYMSSISTDPSPSPDLTDMENYNIGRLMHQTHRGEYLEGVGSLSSYLPFPGALSGSLNNLYDLEGNILYLGLNKELDLDNPKSVSAEKRMADSGQSDIYSIDGQLVRRNAESTDGLEKGIYIFRGKKVLVK